MLKLLLTLLVVSSFVSCQEGDKLAQVSFSGLRSDTGEEMYVSNVVKGTLLTPPETPTSDGGVFAGWYVDPYCKVPFDFETPIEEDMTLYPKWQPSGVVLYDYGKSVPYHTVDFRAGGYYTLPEPRKTGYSFVFWLNDEGERVESSGKADEPFNAHAVYELASISSFDELRSCLEAGLDEIRISGTLVANQTIRIQRPVSIWSDTGAKIVRESGFYGPVFLVEDPALNTQTSKVSALPPTSPVFVLGKRSSGGDDKAQENESFLLSSSSISRDTCDQVMKPIRFSCESTSETALNPWIVIDSGASALLSEGVAFSGGRFRTSPLENNGELTITGAVFEGTKSDSDGGAITNAVSGTLKIEAAAFQATTALGNGGAICNLGKLYITPAGKDSVTFMEGTAKKDGGAVWNGPHSFVQIGPGSSFKNNHAGQNGGAISFLNKAAIEGCEFSGNSSEGDGGAIYTPSKTVLTIKGSQFSNNESQESGGAMFLGPKCRVNIAECDIADNVAQGNGGAICISGARVHLNENTMLQNTALYGGAIFATSMWENYEEDQRISNAVLEVIGGVFSYNVAENGGAISIVEKSTSSIGSSTLISNVASTNGGAIAVQGADIEVIDRSLFDSNLALSGEGGAVYLTYLDRDQSGSYSINDVPTKARFQNVTFTDNVAQHGKSIARTEGVKLSVESVNIDGDAATLDQISIGDNSASL